MIEHGFQTSVARSPEEVFDFLVDLRNAPQWETELPRGREDIGRHDQKGHDLSREEGGMGRLESEIVEFERPAPFASRDTGRGMTCGLNFRCDATDGGTQVSGKL